MILDPDVCVYDADINDAYINYPWPWWVMHVSMMRDFFRTDERTDEQADSRSWISYDFPLVCEYSTIVCSSSLVSFSNNVQELILLKAHSWFTDWGSPAHRRRSIWVPGYLIFQNWMKKYENVQNIIKVMVIEALGFIFKFSSFLIKFLPNQWGYIMQV